MKKNKKEGVKRPYNVVICSGSFRSTDILNESDRSTVVYKASQMFWGRHGNNLGPIQKAMVVSDPYKEANFTDKMSCNDRLYKLLPEDAIDRIIAQSDGQIVREDNPNSANCLKRLKRRRDFGRFVAPNIRKMKNGVLYYRIVEVPQKKEDGQIVQKRKYRDIRLEAKNLQAAVKEIVDRKLRLIHKSNASFSRRTRRKKVLIEYVKAHPRGKVRGKNRKPRKPRARRPRLSIKREKATPIVQPTLEAALPTVLPVEMPVAGEAKTAASASSDVSKQNKNLPKISEGAQRLLRRLTGVAAPSSAVPAASLWANSRSEKEGWGKKDVHTVKPRENISSRLGWSDKSGKIEPKSTDKSVGYHE